MEETEQKLTDSEQKLFDSEITLTELEKFLNETTPLIIDKKEINQILKNNKEETIDIMKQLDDILNINTDYDSLVVQEVDSIKGENFKQDNFKPDNSLQNIDYSKFKVSDIDLIKSKNILPKLDLTKVKSESVSSNPTPQIDVPKIYDDNQKRMKLDLLKNIFQNINNLENTLNKFKRVKPNTNYLIQNNNS